MNEFLYRLFGEGRELTTIQISLRTVAMFLVALLLLRLGGLRIFGKKSAFDEVVIIMLGAVLSRGVVGATPFGETVVSGAIMIGVHRLISWLCIKNKNIEMILKGKPVLLYKNGMIIKKNMAASSISEEDLLESLRIQMGASTFENVEAVYLEPGGRLSFIKKSAG